MNKYFFGSKRLAITMILLFNLFITVVAQVNAASMSCRSDPIVRLSDGTRLQFNTAIEASKDDVISIRYELHVPAGVTIEQINYTPNWARSKETVVLVDDQAPGNYHIVTLAQTMQPNVNTTISAMMVAQRNQGQGSTHQTKTGLSGQPITIHFVR